MIRNLSVSSLAPSGRFVVVLCLVMAATSAVCADPSNRPNIILLMADDLGYDDVGFNGNEVVQTPNLDRMATEGIRFTRFYSIGPVCSPTRACFLTGRHYLRYGMIHVNIGRLPPQEITVANVAQSSGYSTGHFGKWHLGTMSREDSQVRRSRIAEGYGPPWERGYEHTFTTETNIATWDPLDYSGLRIPKHSCTFWSNGEAVPGDYEGSSERIIMDRALSFMEGAVEQKKPFLTTIWFYGPHSPVRAGDELRALYPDLPLGHQHYYGSITAIDQQIGRLRDRLEELGVADDTLILFCSDNGPEGSGAPPPRYNPYDGAWYGSAGEFRGRKRYLYNGGVCVPAFAYWPGVIEAGQTIDTPVCTLDYQPTVANLLEYEMPDERPIDGTSILPLLQGNDWSRDSFIPFAATMQQGSPNAALIRGDYKYCARVTDAGREEALYHLHDDPGEENNLASQFPDLITDMRRQYNQWIASCRHSFEGGNYPDYEVQGRFLELGDEPGE